MSSKEEEAAFPATKYRVTVHGTGIVYDGYSEVEAYVQFRIFVARSQATSPLSAATSVLLFKDAEILREYHPR
jgi:hypothetical protein